MRKGAESLLHNRSTRSSPFFPRLTVPSDPPSFLLPLLLSPPRHPQTRQTRDRERERERRTMNERASASLSAREGERDTTHRATTTTTSLPMCPPLACDGGGSSGRQGPQTLGGASAEDARACLATDRLSRASFVAPRVTEAPAPPTHGCSGGCSQPLLRQSLRRAIRPQSSRVGGRRERVPTSPCRLASCVSASLSFDINVPIGVRLMMRSNDSECMGTIYLAEESQAERT